MLIELDMMLRCLHGDGEGWGEFGALVTLLGSDSYLDVDVLPKFICLGTSTVPYSI